MALTKASYSMIVGAVANVLDYGAVGNGIADDTAAIQAAINSGRDVFLPKGAYLVDPDVGLVVSTGTTIFGEGRCDSILVAKNNGASVAELAAYAKGSVIKRSFNPSSTNPYVSFVTLKDFSVILNHPASSVTTTEIQIGIDLRNISRALVTGVWVGNIAPASSVYSKVDPVGGYASQGYGIVCGNVSSGDPAYAGGEVNTIADCTVVGAFKCITIDDGDLCPLSSAHATTVARCDIQAGQSLLVQESQYAANTIFDSNTVQSIVKRVGSSDSSFVLRLEGYHSFVNSGYIEAGTNVDYILYLGVNSKNNRVILNHYGSVTGTAYITDAGVKNSINFYESTATPPAVNGLGAPVYLYDNTYQLQYQNLWVKFHWDGAAIVIDGGSSGVSVSRTGTGDYTVTYPKAFASDDYSVSVAMDTNASGHGGLSTINSHSASNLRLFTFGQNGGTTTQIDPRYVWVTVSR